MEINNKGNSQKLKIMEIEDISISCWQSEISPVATEKSITWSNQNLFANILFLLVSNDSVIINDVDFLILKVNLKTINLNIFDPCPTYG